MNHEKPINAFTVDVEDYYQVEAFSRVVSRDHWGRYESHVQQNTDRILNLLDSYKVKATFFTLGCVAEKHPSIVRNIIENGHEIASHGYSHKLIYKQSKEEFRQETIRSKAILEDIAQTPVKGYRAATYSITRMSLWALDILIEAGFTYDSSIFPIHHDRYGIPDGNPLPHLFETSNGQQIIEFPITTLNTKLFKLPIAGGGYFRLFPYFFSRWALRQKNRTDGEFVFYIHPWEIDTNQPVIQNAGAATKFRHYNGIDKCYRKLERLLTDFQFTTMSRVLEDLNIGKL